MAGADCSTLRDEARDARREAETTTTDTKEDLHEAREDTGKAIALCATTAGGFAAGLAAGIATTPACLGGIWEAVTSWCDVRDSGKEAVDAAEAAADAQTAYLACLNDHKRGR